MFVSWGIKHTLISGHHESITSALSHAFGTHRGAAELRRGLQTVGSEAVPARPGQTDTLTPITERVKYIRVHLGERRRGLGEIFC